MRPFTRRTVTDPEDLEASLSQVRPGRAVEEHGEFRDGVSCAAALVPREDPDDPWWALVVSARAETVPEAVADRLLEAARDLAAAPA